MFRSAQFDSFIAVDDFKGFSYSDAKHGIAVSNVSIEWAYHERWSEQVTSHILPNVSASSYGQERLIIR